MSEQNTFQAQELAELLDVTPASLSGAAKKDHLCKGYPVSEWAIRTDRGRVTGYNVPEKAYRELSETVENSSDELKAELQAKRDELCKKIQSTDDKGEMIKLINEMMEVEKQFPDHWEESAFVADAKWSDV